MKIIISGWTKTLLNFILPRKVGLLAIAFMFFFIIKLSAQTNSKFNVNLLLDYSAAEQNIALFEDQLISTQSLSELRGNRIAASTAGLIADSRVVSSHLQSYLDSLKYHQIIKDDVYHLEAARNDVADIKRLLDEIKKRNFNRRIVATVEQIFPEDADVSITIPVYVVALGHENVDAYVRRIAWQGDTPQFVGEEKGELTIVINLAHSVNYGHDVEEQFISLLGIVAHEVFHAAFEAYKSRSSSWKQFYQQHNRPFDVLLDLTQNEGIAYYLSLDQQGRGYLPKDWNNKMREVFHTFNRNSEEILSDSLSTQRVSQLIRTANLSGYWESYGAMTGMFIAREIDLQLGRSELIKTISHNPYYFFKTYQTLTKQNSNLPLLSTKITLEITKNLQN